MKIRNKIILTFSAMSLLAITTLSVIILYHSFKGMKRVTDSHERTNAKLVSERIDSAFNNISTRMLMIANTVKNLNYIDYDELSEYLAGFLKEYDDLDAAIALEDGQFMNAQKWKAPIGFANQRPWYIGAKKTEKLFIGEPYASVSDAGTYVAMSLSKSFTLKNGSTAVIMNDIYLSQLLAILRNNKLQSGSYIFLLDEYFQILYHPNEKYNISLDKEKQIVNFTNLKDIVNGELFIKTIQAQDENILKVTDYDGVERLFFFEKSAITGYTVCVAVPSHQVYASVNFAATISITVTIVILVLTLIVSFILGSRISKPINDVTGALKEISQGTGDLTVILNSKYDDETGDMSNYFNETIGKIKKAISRISENSNNLRNSSARFTKGIYKSIDSLKEVAQTTESVNQQSINQASSVEETVATTEEILHTINNFINIIKKQSESISNATSSVEEMVTNVEMVTQVLEKNMAQINDLETQSSNAEKSAIKTSKLMSEVDKNSEVLLKASSVIKNIAERTNLLAMNAAIEASHSGDAGKGFAVVASEIRSLANESKVQSKSVTTILGTLKKQVAECVEETVNSEKNFKEIFALSKRIRNHEEYVIQAMVEQRIGNTEVLKSIDEMNTVSHQTNDGSREILDAATQISSEMQNLLSITDKLKSAMQTLSVLSKNINNSLITLGQINDENHQGINELDTELSKFKVE